MTHPQSINQIPNYPINDYIEPKNFSSGNTFNFEKNNEYHSVETWELMKRKYYTFNPEKSKKIVEKGFSRSLQNIKNCSEALSERMKEFKEDNKNLGK